MEKWQSKTGGPYKDKRNWQKYNEELVVQGEFLLDFEWIKTGWEKELKEMNTCKKGAPYKFPESLIKLQAVWHHWIDYREIEGLTRKIVELAKIPDFNDYSTINRRVNKLKVEFELPKKGFVSIATDGTGMKLNNAGEYLHDTYGRTRKKFIKVIMSANPLTGDILDLDISIEGKGISEPEAAQKHIKRQIKNNIYVDKFWGDGSFYVKNLFNLLEKHKIESAIKIRDDASKKANGSMRRAREVREYLTKGYQDWAREKQYGKRWLGTEVIFSAIKRKYGEKVKARKIENMYTEIRQRFWAYSTVRAYARA